MTPRLENTFFTCGGEEDVVKEDRKDCSKIDATTKCDDGTQGLDDCRTIYPCEPRLEPVPDCYRGIAVDPPGRTAKLCIQEQMPGSP